MKRNDGFDEWTDELQQEFREQLEVAREVFESDRTPAQKAVWLELMAEGIDWPTVRFLIRAVRTEMAKLRAEREKAKEAAKEMAEPAGEARPAETLLDWGKRVLPEHFKEKPSGMHRWMADELDRMRTERAGKVNVLGPRGAAKSTLATLAYPLREALERREAYIWLVSDTMEQAHDHLENLKAELLDNPRLAAAYPQAAGRGPIWRAGKIVLRNGVTIEALGTGQRIRGRRARANRPTLIVCDDLQNDRHMQSSLCRQNAAHPSLADLQRHQQAGPVAQAQSSSGRASDSAEGQFPRHAIAAGSAPSVPHCRARRWARCLGDGPATGVRDARQQCSPRQPRKPAAGWVPVYRPET